MTRVSFVVTHPQYFDRIRGSVFITVVTRYVALPSRSGCLTI